MTEHGSTEGRRLDLSALDAGPDAGRTDAVVYAVMDRVRATATAARAPADDLAALVRARRYLLAAAVLLAAVAIGTVLTAPHDRRDAGGTELIAQWANARHVPTNGELLAVYQGYRP